MTSGVTLSTDGMIPRSVDFKAMHLLNPCLSPQASLPKKCLPSPTPLFLECLPFTFLSNTS